MFPSHDLFSLPDGSFAQEGKVDTQADKMVFDIKDQWVIIDLDELHQHLKQNNLKKVYLEDLISQLDWNIILPKN